MNKQAEYYETTGDQLSGSKAEKAYRAAQNHLQPSNLGYQEDLQRLQAKITATATWGGLREGAGRPATGRKRRQYYLDDDEDLKVKAYIDKLRNRD